MKWIVSTLFLLITNHLADGQGEKAGLAETHREKFEEALRWKLSAGDPSGDTKIEVSVNHVRLTLTGSKFWNEPTPAFDAKNFGRLCFWWDIQRRAENHPDNWLPHLFAVQSVRARD